MRDQSSCGARPSRDRESQSDQLENGTTQKSLIAGSISMAG